MQVLTAMVPLTATRIWVIEFHAPSTLNGCLPDAAPTKKLGRSYSKQRNVPNRIGGIYEGNGSLPSMDNFQHGLQLFVKKSGLIGAVVSQVFLEAQEQR